MVSVLVMSEIFIPPEILCLVFEEVVSSYLKPVNSKKYPPVQDVDISVSCSFCLYKDFHNISLVCKLWNAAITPFMYRDIHVPTYFFNDYRFGYPRQMRDDSFVCATHRSKDAWEMTMERTSRFQMLDRFVKHERPLVRRIFGFNGIPPQLRADVVKVCPNLTNIYPIQTMYSIYEKAKEKVKGDEQEEEDEDGYKTIGKILTTAVEQESEVITRRRCSDEGKHEWMTYYDLQDATEAKNIKRREFHHATFDAFYNCKYLEDIELLICDFPKKGKVNIPPYDDAAKNTYLGGNTWTMSLVASMAPNLRRLYMRFTSADLEIYSDDQHVYEGSFGHLLWNTLNELTSLQEVVLRGQLTTQAGSTLPLLAKSNAGKNLRLLDVLFDEKRADNTQWFTSRCDMISSLLNRDYFPKMKKIYVGHKFDYLVSAAKEKGIEVFDYDYAKSHCLRDDKSVFSQLYYID